jgi:hypothetical protein
VLMMSLASIRRLGYLSPLGIRVEGFCCALSTSGLQNNGVCLLNKGRGLILSPLNIIRLTRVPISLLMRVECSLCSLGFLFERIWSRVMHSRLSSKKVGKCFKINVCKCLKDEFCNVNFLYEIERYSK